MRRFVSVDLETTGVDPYTDYIVEVGMAGEDYITGRYFEICFSLDFPEGRMTEGAAAVNGWGKRDFGPMVDHGWAASYIMSQLNDVHIVGKNPQFDTDFLRVFLTEDGVDKVPWHHRLVDIGCLAWGAHCMDYKLDNTSPRVLIPPNVGHCERLLGIPRETVNEFHTALLDARWNYEAFRHLVPKGD